MMKMVILLFVIPFGKTRVSYLWSRVRAEVFKNKRRELEVEIVSTSDDNEERKAVSSDER